MNNLKICDLFANCGVLNDFPFPINDFDSLTQYEMLIKCINHIKKLWENDKTLSNRINTLANYIENLDLQDEVNNKINEMVESGELQEIITSYLQVNGVLAFNTVADMVNATNIIDGSVCKTLGENTYKDGKGQYYKIRTITSGDTVDNVNIIALNISDTLIAEKMPDYYINEINTNIGNLNNLNTEDKSSLVNAINEKEKKLSEMVVLGDSWSDLNVANVVWPTRASNMLHLTLHDYAVSGAGFVKPTNNLISSQVTALENDTSYSKLKVKYVVIMGGVNDYYLNNVDYSDLKTEIMSVITNVKTLCPNAKILFTNNFVYPYNYQQSAYWERMFRELSAENLCSLYNMDGAFGYEVMNTSNYYHLTNAGQCMLASNIVAMLSGGEIIEFPIKVPITSTEFNGYYNVKRVGNTVIMTVHGRFTSGYTSVSLTNLSGNNVFPYGDLWGIITGGIISGWTQYVCAVALNAFTLSLSAASTAWINITFTASIKQ